MRLLYKRELAVLLHGWLRGSNSVQKETTDGQVRQINLLRQMFEGQQEVIERKLKEGQYSGADEEEARGYLIKLDGLIKSADGRIRVDKAIRARRRQGRVDCQGRGAC